MLADPARFNEALARFDAANAEDPHTEVVNGVTYAKALLYAQRMSAWLERLVPDASEALRLAVRCQHIRRWTIPRQQYAMDRRGYLRWRTVLAQFHAATASDILQDVGYDADTIRRVQTLLRKEGLKRDPDVQCLEDVICLVFMENHLADFATQHDTAKLLDILRKTWQKMSPRGQEVARTLSLPSEVSQLVAQALATPES
jgi:hypothetical protein